jgi:hypothetical protein
MNTCIYPACGLPIPLEVDPEDPYCTRECFDAHIAEALAAAQAVEAQPTCNMIAEIKKLCADAEQRVKNIESFGSDKLLKTKEYFQSRADVLNDLLVFATLNTNCSCHK